MVRHQGPRVYRRLGFRRELLQSSDKVLAIRVGPKEVSLLDPPRYHMLQYAFGVQSRSSRHTDGFYAEMPKL
jgi:hypothetical protein